MKKNGCKKKYYRTKLEADMVLVSVWQRKGRSKMEARAYYCKPCRGFHLTSRVR